ncbi:MAG: YetF domain-containing protein [Bacillota bacterium]
MILEILLRTALTFGVLLVLSRVAGKKQLSQATLFDFITAVAVGDLAADHLANPDDPLVPWLLATILWFALVILLDVIVLKNRAAGKILEGEPSVIIQNGRIQEKALAANFLRVDDLLGRLRKQGYFNLADIEFAVFETDGTISVLPKSQARPVQPRDLKIPTDYEGMSREVIVDRVIIRDNLKRMGLTEEWLAGELVKAGYTGADEVFFASIDSQGKLYVDGFHDPIDGIPMKVGDTGPH